MKPISEVSIGDSNMKDRKIFLNLVSCNVSVQTVVKDTYYK
jgi:hypothetical protein